MPGFAQRPGPALAGQETTLKRRPPFRVARATRYSAEAIVDRHSLEAGFAPLVAVLLVTERAYWESPRHAG